MTSCTGSTCGGFWGFWRTSVSWVLRSEEEGWLSLARSGLVAGATRVGGEADGKASIERLCLSLYVEKPLNSKVIKKFCTWTKKSGFLRSMYICYEHSMYVPHIHVWLCYTVICLHTVKWSTSSITNNSILHKSFVCKI